jgi:hypothetical protein
MKIEITSNRSLGIGFRINICWYISFLFAVFLFFHSSWVHAWHYYAHISLLLNLNHWYVLVWGIFQIFQYFCVLFSIHHSVYSLCTFLLCQFSSPAQWKLVLRFCKLLISYSFNIACNKVELFSYMGLSLRTCSKILFS